MKQIRRKNVHKVFLENSITIVGSVCVLVLILNDIFVHFLLNYFSKCKMLKCVCVCVLSFFKFKQESFFLLCCYFLLCFMIYVGFIFYDLLCLMRIITNKVSNLGLLSLCTFLQMHCFANALFFLPMQFLHLENLFN